MSLEDLHSRRKEVTCLRTNGFVFVLKDQGIQFTKKEAESDREDMFQSLWENLSRFPVSIQSRTIYGEIA